MSETKKYIDLNYLQSFWTFIKGIPTSVKYTLNNKSQTIKGAIDDLGTNKQDKLEPGFGIEIDDNTIDAEVEYSTVDNEWVDTKQTFAEGCQIENIHYVWTDKNNNWYYSYGKNQLYLDSSDNTWKKKDWGEVVPPSGYFYGNSIWKDLQGEVYFSYVYNSNKWHYHLNTDTNLWERITTWNSSAPFDGNYVWHDGTTVYYSYIKQSSSGDTYKEAQLYLDPSDNTWKQMTWQGSVLPPSAPRLYDYSGNIYFVSQNSTNSTTTSYKYNKGSHSLSPSGWTNAPRFLNGSFVKFEGHIFWINSYENVYRELINNEWVPITNVAIHNMVSSYQFQAPDDHVYEVINGKVCMFNFHSVKYITNHNDELQIKLTAGHGIKIDSNNVISTINGLEIGTTSDTAAAGDHTHDEFQTLQDQITALSDAQSPLTPGFGIEIDGNDTILAEVEYREGDGECNDAARAILGGDWRIPTKEDWNELISNTTATWNDGIQLTSRINGQTIFLPAGGTYIDYDVDGDVLAGTYWTSSASSNAAPNNLIAHDVLFDMGGNISVRSFNKYNGELIRPITKTPGNNVVDLGLPSGTLWSTHNLTATGLTSSITSYGDYFAWGEIAPKSEYSSETYSLKNSYNTTDGIFVLKTGGEAGYFTRHNDELQTKLKAGDNITISNGVISAIGGDLSNYYNKTEVDNKISAVPKFSISVVSTLPTTNISSTTVYLVANTTTQTQNLYTEYIYVNSKWEKLGEQTIDLSGYATTTALNAKQDSLTTAQLSAVNSGITSTKVSTYDGYANSIANKVDKASGKGLSTNDYTTTEKNKLAGIAENANNYSHPTYTTKTSGLYKITVDGTGHVSGTAAVTASDLPTHSHTGYLTTETDPVFSASAAAGITSTDITNWNGKTSNTGTVTQVKIGSTAYNPTSGVISLPAYPTVSYPVSSVAGKTGTVTLSSSDVGLGNVGNFKAVSTVASQELTDAEKSNARANIGAGTSSLTLGTTSTTAAAGNHTHSNYLTGITKDMVTTALGYTPPTTDTNTWRGIQNNLTSTSTTDSLSAAQGKALNDKFGSYLPLTGGTVTGTLTLSKTTDIASNTASGGALIIGSATGSHIAFDPNEIMAKGSATTTGTLNLNYDGGNVFVGSGGIDTKGRVAIGRSAENTGGCVMTYNSTNKCLEFTF